jgi:hypothetical protein
MSGTLRYDMDKDHSAVEPLKPLFLCIRQSHALMQQICSSLVGSHREHRGA